MRLSLLLAAMLLPAFTRAEDRPTGVAAMTLPAGFSATLAAGPELSPYGMCAAFDDAGHLFVTQSSGKDRKAAAMVKDPDCAVWRLTDRDGDGIYDEKTVFADKLSLPMGALYHDGSLYVASPPDLFKFTDADGDGIAEKKEVILTGWNVKNTASLHGPFLGPDGWLYLTHGRHGYKIETKEGTTLEGEAARLWRCRPDGSGLERYCGGGFDNPVELIFTPGWQMIGTMTYFTNPKNGQRDALNHWIEGGVYPKPNEVTKEFKLTGDLLPSLTHFARVAPAGLVYYRGSAFGAEYKGNLFSAQFNPHRVQRHVISEAGSTFKSVDSDFLISADPDFHATDVTEDADGSLLVIDTGGWYVDACPLSRDSKPDIRGGIYRIRRAAAVGHFDPRGTKIDFKGAKAETLEALAQDEQPVVRDRARGELIGRGEAGRGAMYDVMRKATTPTVRSEALGGMTQLALLKNVVAARPALRIALRDDDAIVRAAAARACALAQDKDAVGRIRKLAVKDPSLQVRRQCAAALGMIGDPRSVKYLLEAASAATDRMHEHAIIDALIRINDPEPLRRLLFDDRPDRHTARVRRAALIALGQMDAGKLTEKEILPFLESPEPLLSGAAVFLAAHHEDWDGKDVVGVLTRRLKQPPLEEVSREQLRQTIAAFIDNEAMQTALGEVAANAAASDEVRIEALDLIDQADLHEFPKVWDATVGTLIQHARGAVRLRAFRLAKTHQLKAHFSAAEGIATGANETPTDRIAAAGLALGGWKELPPGIYEFLAARIVNPASPEERVAAAQVIAAAPLDAGQRVSVASGLLAGANPLIRPSLMEVFRLNEKEFEEADRERIGRAFVAALAKEETLPSPTRLEQMLAPYPDSVKQAAMPLLEKANEQRAEMSATVAKLEPMLTGGDVGRGRAVFFGEKAACFTCHAIGKEGGTLGPDLTSVGRIRSGRDLLEALAFPSATFVPDYVPVRVETGGDVLNGIIGSQDAASIVLRTGANAEVRLPRATITAMDPSTVSIMPEGIPDALPPGELRDLMAFLQSLNGQQWLAPEVREKN